MAYKALFMKAMMLLMVFVVSCQGRNHWVGKYEARMVTNQEVSPMSLELMANGSGSWALGEESTSFKWEIRKNEIWLHTKSGGLIVGKMKDDGIEVDLPGAGRHLFTRMGH